MIQRTSWISQLQHALLRHRVVILSGPRQSGKTTLARHFVAETSPNYFDLEDPLSLVRLDEPMTTLSALEGVIVIDEVQLRPDLFPMLRVLADRASFKGQFLILGSASGQLLHQSSESLAGRCDLLNLRGFNLQELGQAALTQHWLRGGFPRSYLAATEDDSVNWRKAFIQTLLNRDFPMWGVKIAATTLWRFWTMLAHYHGQIFNAAELARAMGVSQSTIRRYIDLLTDAYMIRQLQPWHANIRKRQVKSPKVYLRDSGLLHQLLGIHHHQQLMTHPKIGASWEGYVIEELLSLLPEQQPYFWATHQGAEMDLLVMLNDERHGFECKRADAPKMTPSIRIALEDLQLAKVTVIYPGTKHYRLAEAVEVVPIAALTEQPWRS